MPLVVTHLSSTLCTVEHFDPAPCVATTLVPSRRRAIEALDKLALMLSESDVPEQARAELAFLVNFVNSR